MTVLETIGIISDLREVRADDLSVQEHHAIGIALVIMIAMDPAQRALIDSLLSMPDPSRN